jgi:hypothetical protein
MPIYVMRNSKTEEVIEKFINMSEREQWLKDNPEWEQMPTAMGVVSGVKSPLRMAGSGWCDVLNKVKTGSGRGNNIKT